MAEQPERILTTPDELAEFCTALSRLPHFGFDTEFIGEETYHPRLCLVQVATPDGLFLIDPVTVGPLDAFWNLVVDPGRVVVVHAGREEVRLCRLWTGRPPGNLFDLQLAAALVGLPYPVGHGPLIHHLLGVRLPKGETLTDWRRRPLTPAQVRYAFDDVRYLLPAWQRLAERLDELGRTSWAHEEFQRLLVAAAPEDPAEGERWRKLRGLGSLDRKRLAVVRALYRWREEEAARSNRPTRAIVRDDLLLEIARRNPARERDLHVVRGLPRRDLEAIVRIVEEARALPPEQWPAAVDREQDPPPVTLASAIVGAVLTDLCVRRELAVGLAASGQDVKALVRARHAGRPLPDDSPLMRGWRAEHLLPDLLAVLDGRRTVRIADLGASAPLDCAEHRTSAQEA
jgi:ribonuclease D